MLKRFPQFSIVLLQMTDLAVLLTAWLGGFWLRGLAGRWELTPHEMVDPERFYTLIGLSTVLAILIYNRFDLYKPARTKSIWVETGDVIRAIVVTWLVIFTLANLLQSVRPSRILMGGMLLSWAVLAPLSRLCARLALRFFRQNKFNLRSAAIVGTGRLGQKLRHLLETNSWTGIEPIYFVSDTTDRKTLCGLQVRSGLDHIEEILHQNPVDIVFLAMPGDSRRRTEELLNTLAQTTVNVCVVPDLLGFHFLRFDVHQLDTLPIISLTHTPQSGWNALLKRAFDILTSALGLIVFALPMALIALAIKLTSPGPVFYSQIRTSLGGTPFRILKFRTMVRDAERQTGAVWAVPDDPRVTAVGRFLRRSSLDELPQLFNVLAGQMSMVGPRPERPELIKRFRQQVPRYMLRQKVKAGLTGWAQIFGLRGQTSIRKRVQYDLYYITNWSFGLDLRILLMTPFRGLISPNAY
jgi:exopolysaccharide biosynthesis polyprenyl glycosylphosphotransferase